MSSEMSELKALEIAALVTGITPRSPPHHVVHHAASALRQLLNDGVPSSDPRCLALLQLINSARLILLPNSNDAAVPARDLTSRAVHIDVSTATLAALMNLKGANTLTGQAVAQAKASLHHRPQHTPAASASTAQPSLKLKLLPKLAQTATDTLFSLVRNDDNLGARAAQDAHARTSTPSRYRSRASRATTRRRRSSLVTPSGASVSAPSPMSAVATANASAAQLQPALVGPSVNPSPLPHSSSFPVATAAGVPSASLPSGSMSAQLILHRASIEGGPSTHLLPSATTNILRSKPLPKEPRPKGTRSMVANQKGVMNDAIGTPDEVMEAFLQGPRTPAQPSDPDLDSQTKIRAVLAERERNLVRLHRRRRAELAAMPLGMTEQTRRKAIIEAKQLSLLDLQRVVRHRVCAEMKKMQSLYIQEDGFVPSDNLSRLFRRRDPPIYSYMDGYPRITPFDAIPEMPPRHPDTIAQDSIRMAQFDMSRMRTHAVQRRIDYNEKLLKHVEKFKTVATEAKNARARIWKSFERYFIEKRRVEERKKKLEQIERLKLLRSNDEQAYLDLLKNTKNERLLQLVRQTDSYLMRIGAQVERQREAPEKGDGIGHQAFGEEMTDGGEVPIEAMRQRRDMYYTITHAVQEEVQQPSIMVHGTLKQYQVEGLKWMVSLYNNNLNGILADEMGLGKTIQTISLITYLVESKRNPGPYMIIVPLSTMGNWVRELELWAPSLVKVVYRGDRYTRRNIQRNELVAGKFNVLLTTYEFTVKDQHVLSPIAWQYIIIDEGHRMKNANCKLAMTLGIKYKSRNRLLLTGTPLQNNLTELWALLNFLLPTIFSSAETFETWFKQPFESTTLGDTAELEEEETLLVINRLHQVLRPFLLRRLKTDVLAQLPQKVEHVIRCDMSAWQRALYRQVRNRMGLATGANNGSVRAFNNLLMQFKKVCNHPYLFYDAESIEHLPPEFLIRASGKFFLLQHMLPKLRLNGHRTLIFSQMTAALDYLELFLSQIGIAYMRLDGNTRADDRQELLNLFNAPDSPYFCFLLSTRAGGLGLNLQTADTVIIFDSDWNPMMDLQAQDRAHRIGQTRVVRVYRLISSGTIEVKILDQANKKLQVDAQVIQAGQFNNKSTENDRHQMLKDLLRQRHDEGDNLGDVPTREELNRLIARTDDEIEAYIKYDEEAKKDGTFNALLEEESDLPEWVLRPDVDHKDAEEKEMELLQSHGRGMRKRKTTHDMDLLTEAEWFKVAQGEFTVEEVFEKRRKRKEARRSGATSVKGNGNENGELDENETNGEDDGGEASPRDKVDVSKVESEEPKCVESESGGEAVEVEGGEAEGGEGKKKKKNGKRERKDKKGKSKKNKKKNGSNGMKEEESVQEDDDKVVKLKLKVRCPSSKSEGEEMGKSGKNGRRKRQREGSDNDWNEKGGTANGDTHGEKEIAEGKSASKRLKGTESGSVRKSLKIIIPNGRVALNSTKKKSDKRREGGDGKCTIGRARVVQTPAVMTTTADETKTRQYDGDDNADNGGKERRGGERKRKKHQGSDDKGPDEDGDGDDGREEKRCRVEVRETGKEDMEMNGGDDGSKVAAAVVMLKLRVRADEAAR